MKNNRRITLSNSFIAENNLSTSPPPQDSLFWTMWNACVSIANQTLETNFIQGINKANLDPVIYGGFNVSDAYYCFNGAQDYLVAASNATDPTLKAFLNKKYLSYQKYNETFPTVWHIKDAYGIVPSEACKNYAEFESNVASHEESIYTLIAMLPCEYLWAWLGEQLSPPADGNLYAPWITGNNDPSGAYAMGNYIDLYQKSHFIDEDKAIQLYTKAMNHELQNFATATN
ncbi:MAG: hypothetical protein JXR05_03755 [Flavobacteriaceae bacterium]